MRNAAREDPRRPPEAGFSLLELLVALFIMAEILVAVLVLFDSLNRTSRLQSQVADMQQSLRVGQMDVLRLLRMAGRGGLQTNLNPVAVSPAHFGSALEVRDNVRDGDNDEIAIDYVDPLGSPTPVAVAGTDILTVRGVFNPPLYIIDIANPADFVPRDLGGDPGAEEADVIVRDRTSLDIAQDLSPLIQMIDAGVASVPVVIVDSGNSLNYAVVELAPVSSTHGIDPNTGGTIATLRLQYTTADALTYLALSPGATPGDLPGLSTLGLLEEYRFYVREEFVVPNDPASFLASRLTMAQMVPGTEQPLASDPANLQLDVADNIVDLQVSLGLDTDFGGATVDDDDGEGQDDTICEGSGCDAGGDDWLFNDPADDPTDPEWTVNDNPGNPAPGGRPSLHYVRVSTLAVSDSKDPTYRAPDPGTIENHDYADNAWVAAGGRMHRGRALQTIIDLRNISQ